FPILIVAAFLPRPYGIQAPADIFHFLLFLVTLLLGLAVTVSFCMLVYVISFFTISAEGVRIVFVSSVEFFSGAIIPLPFFPEKIQMVMELLPFASMQNAALRIYSGSMTVPQMKKAVILQLFWLIILIWTGRRLCARAEKRIIVQGG
ncbi:MAG: ABC-2 family transporter protein, partial [Eubacterium sp.]|nr:ABC-2 family transporter protein [Eubacterium sp.]